MISNYKDLIFWQKAHVVVLSVIKLCKKLPKDGISIVLINQIIRSAGSVGANIAEGFGRYKGKEYKRYIQIALGSANETEYWLYVIIDSYPEFKPEINKILEINTEVIKMLTSSLRKLNSNSVQNLDH